MSDSKHTAFNRRFVTHQGTRIHTRLIQPQDADLLIDLFEHLSAETRWRRFHVSVENVERARVREIASQLANVDNRVGGGAVLALTEDERLVGVARLARPTADIQATTAEVAVVVRDDFQGQGIGLSLLELLVRLARHMDIKTLSATVQADNAAIFTMLRRLNLPVTTQTRSGETTMEIRIDET